MHREYITGVLAILLLYSFSRSWILFASGARNMPSEALEVALSADLREDIKFPQFQEFTKNDLLELLGRISADEYSSRFKLCRPDDYGTGLIFSLPDEEKWISATDFLCYHNLVFTAHFTESRFYQITTLCQLLYAIEGAYSIITDIGTIYPQFIYRNISQALMCIQNFENYEIVKRLKIPADVFEWALYLLEDRSPTRRTFLSYDFCLDEPGSTCFSFPQHIDTRSSISGIFFLLYACDRRIIALQKVDISILDDCTKKIIAAGGFTRIIFNLDEQSIRNLYLSHEFDGSEEQRRLWPHLERACIGNEAGDCSVKWTVLREFFGTEKPTGRQTIVKNLTPGVESFKFLTVDSTGFGLSDLWYLSDITDLTLCCHPYYPEQNWVCQLPNLCCLSILRTMSMHLERMDNMEMADIPGSAPDFICLNGIGQLTNLRKLTVHDLTVRALPEDIGRLGELREIILNNTCLSSLPDRIDVYDCRCSANVDMADMAEHSQACREEARIRHSGLRKLELLHLSVNNLTHLPDWIGYLPMLRDISLERNMLGSLPESMANLPNFRKGGFTRLDLSHNRLTELPRWFSQFHGMIHLYLAYNYLESLPFEMLRLRHTIFILDIRNNPVERSGNGDALGQLELRLVFGPHVLLPPTSILSHTRPTKVGLDKATVYSDMRRTPLHWNIETIRATVLASPPTDNQLTVQTVLEIWNAYLRQYEPHGEEYAGREMDRYIETLYNTESSRFDGWMVNPENASEVKFLLEAVFTRFRERIKQGTDQGDAQAYVPELCNALTFCPDRQIAAFRMVYAALYGKKEFYSFTDFVHGQISVLKEHVFDSVVLLGEGTQSVHVLNTWKYAMRGEIGFDTEFCSRLGTFEQDIFLGDEALLLQVFYDRFTPEYVINSLAETINSSRERMTEAMLCLQTELLNDIDYRRKAFHLADEENAAEDLKLTTIRPEGMEEILVKMGILIREQT